MIRKYEAITFVRCGEMVIPGFLIILNLASLGCGSTEPAACMAQWQRAVSCVHYHADLYGHIFVFFEGVSTLLLLMKPHGRSAPNAFLPAPTVISLRATIFHKNVVILMSFESLSIDGLL